jgi:hypothetical protein
MISYKDKSYCNADCPRQGGCVDSYDYASKEKQAHPDGFIRANIPIAVTDMSSDCSIYIILKESKYATPYNP